MTVLSRACPGRIAADVKEGTVAKRHTKKEWTNIAVQGGGIGGVKNVAAVRRSNPGIEAITIAYMQVSHPKVECDGQRPVTVTIFEGRLHKTGRCIFSAEQ